MTLEPAGWQRQRLRFSYDEVDRRLGTPQTDLPLLSVSIHHGVRLRDETTDREARADEFGNYKLVQPNDLVINRMRAFEGGLGISSYAGIVSADYAVLRARPTLEPRFLHHLFRSTWFVGEMTARLRGIGSAEQGNVRTPRINVEDLGNIEVALPSLAGQQAIADYLDAETARIDGLVARRRAILERVSERRRSATDRVLADQGLGRWPVVRLKYLIRGLIDTLHATAPDEDDGPGVIVGTACIKGGSLDLAAARRCSAQTLDLWTARAVPRPGDVLFTREAPAGEAALVPSGVALAPGQRVVLVQTNPDRMLPELIVHSIYSTRASEFFQLLGRETTVLHLNMSDIGSIPVVLPPRDEQVTVARRITDELSRLDAIAAAMTQQIRLLLERRQALITATVTGVLQIPRVAG